MTTVFDLNVVKGDLCEDNKCQHVYRDHALDMEDDSWRLDRVKMAWKSNNSSSTNDSFPVKLHQMLEEVERNDMTHIVSWQPHGRCFVVRDQTKFANDVMTVYFNQTKFSSFQRQLNLYGFHRITSGTDRGAYYHELFLKHKRFLCRRIQRCRVKGTRVRKGSSPESEPDFYAMTPMSVQHDPTYHLGNGSNSGVILQKSTNKILREQSSLVSENITPRLKSVVPQQTGRVLSAQGLQSNEASPLLYRRAASTGAIGDVAATTQQRQRPLSALSSPSQWRSLLSSNLTLMRNEAIRRNLEFLQQQSLALSSQHQQQEQMDEEEEEEREFDAILSALVNMPVDHPMETTTRPDNMKLMNNARMGQVLRQHLSMHYEY